MNVLRTDNRITHRQMLRGAEGALSLLFLEAMLPPFAQHLFAKSKPDTKAPRRFLRIYNNLGVLPDRFSPRWVAKIISSSLAPRD